jgi:ferredoxin
LLSKCASRDGGFVFVHVNRQRCQGHGQCAANAPAVFGLDALGYVTVERLGVPPELEAEARRGANSCPERAIAVEEGTTDVT